MSNTLDTARAFFEACESGQGWEACTGYCRADAVFSCQSGALADVATVQQYAEWMAGMKTPVPDAAFEIKSIAEDAAAGCVMVFAIFTGTHTGPGGPGEPTGKTVKTDYVFVIQMDNGTISGVIKIWNDAYALAQLGWA
ncbi:MAG: ester cyclase [Planctomycetota bacterium]